MANENVNMFIQKQESKISKIKSFYQEKLNEGTCFSKSIAQEIESQMKSNMSLDSIFNYWFNRN